MPFDFELDETANLLTIAAHGNGSLDDVLTGLDRLDRELDGRSGAHVLIDNHSYDINPTTLDLRLIAQRFARLRPRLTGRVLIVVRPGLQYGLGRMFAAFAEFAGLRVEMYSARSAALAALAAGDPA